MNIDTPPSRRLSAFEAHAPIEKSMFNAIRAQSSNTWVLVEPLRLLINNEITINLTKMEYAVLDLLIGSRERIVSNDAIAKKLNKNLDHYKGLAMCLSRLQAKFKKSARGDNLFRSVRNRGYCIVQAIHIEKDLSHRHNACDEKTWKRCSPNLRHSIYLLAGASADWVEVCSSSGTRGAY